MWHLGKRHLALLSANYLVKRHLALLSADCLVKRHPALFSANRLHGLIWGHAGLKSTNSPCEQNHGAPTCPHSTQEVRVHYW